MPDELIADDVEASESHNDNDNDNGIGNDDDDDIGDNELFVDDVFECLSVCNGVGLLGTCDTECILDDDVLDDNAGMIL